MQTEISETYLGTKDGEEAGRILRTCVHCGFCTATCPTYQLLGDELDGPRGRIYQIKQILEGAKATRTVRVHLDRCLTCRSCESTCPSGVDYARLLDIGRNLVEDTRSTPDKLIRKLMLNVLPYPARFAPAAKLGTLFSFMLPKKLSGKLPKSTKSTMCWPTSGHQRKVAVLSGCVQPTLAPDIDISLAVVLDRAGIETVAVRNNCCGALPAHLTDEARAEKMAIETIDLVWPLVEDGIEAIISTASGCGVTLKEYDWLLRHNKAYSEKAKRVSELASDPVEVIEKSLDSFEGQPGKGETIVYHPPCTQQHGMKIKGNVEKVLTTLGYKLLPFNDAHLCCGSAGTYSLFQPKISSELRERKLEQLQQPGASAIATANIGCMTHLSEKSELPVIHWLTLVARSIS